ncbi:TetR/AcrR family transcriptional regulator [Aestuariispira ectoiniformans]|uniref:TetR/AcrR family transcriptional regulator n=1 Tax=Aestuariispira ectoiniformans TaxID=2775080 RepID=UPI00223B8497|nr:TetR/AcrR family transcriptional regulator [Aestuariispira ectoiniformans]
MSTLSKIDQKMEMRRAAILEAARNLFCEHGLSGTTLEMITAEVGGSRRTIYELFGNKDGVFEAVVRDSTSKVIDIIKEINFTDLPLRDALIEFGMNLMTFLTQPETIRCLRLFLGEVPRFPHMGKVFYESGLMTGRRILKSYFEEQMDKGEMPKVDAMQAATFFMSLMKADYDFRQMTQVGWEPNTPDLKQHVTNAVDMFLRGYGIPSAAPVRTTD